jgi:putative two-component system response regulator
MAKLLIVDDNRQNLALMRDFTEGWGYTVLTSTHGTAAIEMTQAQMPDAILLDVMIPGMSGYEVCKELKENEQTANIPIIMVTALMDMEDRIHGLKLGADYFLSKPLPYNELKVVLENVINKKLQIEAGETGYAVMAALTSLVGTFLMPGKFAPQPDMVTYGGKIVRLLHLDKKVEEQVSFATMLYNTGIIMEKKKIAVLLESLKGLKLGGWLTPLVKGMIRFMDHSAVEEGTETENAVKIMAVLMDYFISFEKLKNEGETLELLQKKQVHDEKVLAALKRVVSDKNMLDFLQTAQ